MNRILATSTALAVVLLGGSSLSRADDTTVTTPPATQSTTATASTSAGKLIGQSVTTATHEPIGKINGVLVDAAGNIKYVIVDVIGTIDGGLKQVALAWSKLTLANNATALSIDMTRAELQAAPAYRYADPARRGTVYGYDEDLTTNPYLADKTLSPVTAPPVPGANSFTETQARNRIEASGYSGVVGLKKDAQSIWRGTAMKAGNTVKVALDFKGNVVSQP
jgi:hypothetical protein